MIFSRRNPRAQKHAGPCRCVCIHGETEITRKQNSSEVPEMRRDAATAYEFCRFTPPRDAFRSNERPFRFSLDRNASRGGQNRQNPWAVAASQGISGSSDEKKTCEVLVSPWTGMGVRGPGPREYWALGVRKNGPGTHMACRGILGFGAMGPYRESTDHFFPFTHRRVHPTRELISTKKKRVERWA